MHVLAAEDNEASIRAQASLRLQELAGVDDPHVIQVCALLARVCLYTHVFVCACVGACASVRACVRVCMQASINVFRIFMCVCAMCIYDVHAKLGMCTIVSNFYLRLVNCTILSICSCMHLYSRINAHSYFVENGSEVTVTDPVIELVAEPFC